MLSAKRDCQASKSSKSKWSNKYVRHVSLDENPVSVSTFLEHIVDRLLHSFAKGLRARPLPELNGLVGPSTPLVHGLHSA